MSNPQTKRRRPFGLAVLSVLIACQFGFGSLVVALVGPPSEPVPEHTLRVVYWFVTAIAAFCTARGLWIRASWALTSYVALCAWFLLPLISLRLARVIFWSIPEPGDVEFGLVMSVALFGNFVIMVLVGIYVRSRLQPA